MAIPSPAKLPQTRQAAIDWYREVLTRATARPAFKKAYADQMAHFEAADAALKAAANVGPISAPPSRVPRP